MLVMERERGIEESHSSFETYKLDKIPEIEHIIISNASKLYIEKTDRGNYGVTCQFSSHKENLFVCYREHEAKMCLDVISILLSEQGNTNNRITPEMIESETGITFARFVYGEGKDERKVLQR